MKATTTGVVFWFGTSFVGAHTAIELHRRQQLQHPLNESEIVSEILRRILRDMQDASAVALSHLTKGLVGIESRVHDVIRILNIESSEVCFIGICGMSGIGKTTLAEVVFESIRNTFQASSFIGNIKDISKEHDSDLCKLQQKILDDVLKDESASVRSVKHGQTLLMTKLRDLKVIIVLDDVNHADQFMYLAGGREWFGPGTRIIVTTTNAELLSACRVNDIFICDELKHEEALRLFCQSAFVDGHPTHGYEKLSQDIVNYAGGLPLALTVYGSLLFGKEEIYWKEILKKVQEYPHKEVLGRLEVGYVRLDRHQQHTFMYIACFLKGRDIDLVKDILTDIGLYPECGITDLINKFLISIDFVDCVWMHDLLQQMCWEILRKESQQYNGKQIAIKNRQDVFDILSSKPKESRTIEIINQEPCKVEVDDCIDDPSCFSKMRRLKFLRICNIHFPKGLNYLSNDLRILEWYGCSLKSLPSMFEPKHIYQLEMCYSQLEMLWEKNLDLPHLRSIDLSFSKDLTKIPDLTLTPNLVKLNLQGCTKLKELHPSVLCHKRLQFADLSGCTHLQSLGRNNMEMEALVTLLLSGCSNLEYLPESLGELCNLRKLDASETSIQDIPLSIQYLKRLRLLRVHRCQLSSQSRGFLFTKLDMVPSGLKELDLSYCNLSVVPDCIGLLHRLVNLDLSGNDFVFLPPNISLLSNLRILCLNNCKRLQSLPKLSIVNEDTLYGLQMRYSYIISQKSVDASKFHATSNNSSPMVSCLNCPNLAENESASNLAERIVNSYLQVSSPPPPLSLTCNTLIDMHGIFKRFIEINQKVLSECIEEWSSAELFPLFYDYYRIVQGTLDLYNDFLRLLKDAFDSCLSVKVALLQIVTKSRIYNDYSYKEMLEQLNDLEAAEGIMFCDNFVTSLTFINTQTVAFSRRLNEEIEDIEKCKSMIRLAKVSSITITCIFSILATYACTDEELQEMKGASSYSLWLDLVRSVVKRPLWLDLVHSVVKSSEQSHVMRSYRKELRIWDFVGSAVVVQELKVKMARFASFTRQSEEEMMIVITKLEKMLDNISVTIEDMRWHAHLYSLHIRKAGITLNQFIVDSNLQLSIPEMMSCASSLTSTTRRVSKGYDVFLSFRGEDTRTGFTSHLYEALIRKGIRTYKDDKSLDTGEFIAPELLEAIMASRFAIVIISSNFATSKWCLEEITKVVDCMEQGRLIVIPVFYHVSPSDVRHQSNCFEQGFAIHVANPEITQQKVATWRSAFAKVGAINGFHDLPNLRSIDLSFSEDLTKIPDLTLTPNLVKLNLQGCTKLKELHHSVLCHKRLQFADLSGCTHLQSLGRNNMEMEALVTLLLSGCSNLEYIPEFGHNMKCLEHLYVDGTNIKKLPESLGELRNLRKLDASETSIQFIPLSIQYLKRLRLLRVHRCQLSSQSRGFLFTKLDMVPSGLKELDLSYCNLSVVPDCIGLLHRLVNLDLSGNDFVFLPANISLLSNLRILCLNNCKRLQLLPKLSIVNEDTLYGLQMRYSYIISQKRVDVSKFHATSNNSSPMVSCLNCPKLAENESASYLAERIVNSYLQLRSKYWTTPEAVFEIIGAGRVIPLGFKLLRSNENFTLEGPWIGVVICAVVALHHIDAAIETKYVVTAHIHVGEKNWRIPVPINLLVAGLKNQLVFYWTTADDLQRIVDPSQKNNFKFSFSMEPQDCKVQVTKFGVRFIHEKDIMKLKQLKNSTNRSVYSGLKKHIDALKAVTFLRSCYFSINHDLTLIDMPGIFKRFIEINQEDLSGCIEEWIAFSRRLNEEFQDIKKRKSMIRMAKVSSITIACIFSILATYVCTDEQLQEMKGASSYSMWLDLVRSVVKMRSCNKELRIWDFVGSAVVVQELKVKMARFASFTRQSEEEMMIAITKLEKMLDNISVTIEDMRRHAHLYSLHIRKAGITLNQFIVDSNLQLSIPGVRFMQPNEEQQYENPVSEAMSILYRATLSLTLTNLQWYCACVEEEADDSNPIIHDNARSVKVICGPCPTGKGKSLYDIHKVITCLHAINQEAFMVLSECKEEWRGQPQLFHFVHDYHSICLQTFQLYNDFVRLLKGRCERQLSVILTLHESVVNLGEDDNNWNYKRTVACIRHLDEKFQELKSWKVCAKVISGLIADFYGVMTVFIGEYIHFQWMEERTLARTWLHLIRSLSWKNPSLGELLAIDEFLYIDFLFRELKHKMNKFCFAGKKLEIDSAAKKINKLMVALDDTSRHAC
ncbi:hypothetical protein E3N88_36873 [Mikania micrantha]|uniref:TIR domain-containing protein n=1 Tax=Mikania micrantha TaxID=192012 RepID=A0A5N6M7M9_9ASTR|nr:hypothetical protein E3N88_36873 [Mikania micrantha]